MHPCSLPFLLVAVFLHAALGLLMHGVVLTAWFLVVLGLALQRFWDFWVVTVPA